MWARTFIAQQFNKDIPCYSYPLQTNKTMFSLEENSKKNFYWILATRFFLQFPKKKTSIKLRVLFNGFQNETKYEIFSRKTNPTTSQSIQNGRHSVSQSVSNNKQQHVRVKIEMTSHADVQPNNNNTIIVNGNKLDQSETNHRRHYHP